MANLSELGLLPLTVPRVRWLVALATRRTASAAGVLMVWKGGGDDQAVVEGVSAGRLGVG